MNLPCRREVLLGALLTQSVMVTETEVAGVLSVFGLVCMFLLIWLLL